MVAGVDVVGAFLGQHDVIAVDGVVAVGVAVAREGDRQTFTRRFFVGRGESAGDGAYCGGVFFNRGRSNFNHWHIVVQVDGRLAFAIGACALRVGDGQVDFWQLITSVNVVSALLGQHDVVAVDGVVAVGVAVAREGDGQAFAWGFFVGCSERPGNSARSGRVLFQRIGDDFNHWHIVVQIDGRLAGTRGVRARWISNSQVDFWQLVASVNKVSTLLSQHNVVAVEGVVAVGVAVAREGDGQAFAWGFFVGGGESAGDGAECGGVFFQGVGDDVNHWHVVVQVDCRLAGTSGVRARWISNSQVDFRQLVAGVDVVGAFLRQHDVVAVDGVVAVGVAVAREGDGQAFAWGFFVGRGEGTGDGADCGGVFFQGVGDDFNHWHIVVQVDGRLAGTRGVRARWIGHSQVDLRQLVARVDVVSALLSQHNVVAVDGVVAVGVAVASKGNRQAFTWGFFVGRGESAGDGAYCGGVFFNRGRSNFNDRHVVVQVDGRLATVAGVRPLRVGDGQVDFWQLVAGVNVVSTLLSQHNIVAVDGVVAVGVAVASKGNRQTFARGFFVGRGECTGDGADCCGVFFQGVGDDFNHWHIVVQVDGRLAFAVRACALRVGDGQVNLRQLIASINVVGTLLSQHNVVAVDGVIAVGVAVAREGNGQAFAWGFFIGCGEGTGDGADCGGVFFQGVGDDFNHRHIVVQVDGRLAGTRGVSARWIGDGQIDLRQLVASVNVVSAFLGQHNIVAVDGVVTIGVAGASKGDRQTFTRRFFVGRSERPGNSARSGRVLFQRIGNHFNHRHIILQVHGRLTSGSGVLANRVGDGQVDLRQLVASVNKVSTLLSQHNVVAVDGVVAVGVAVARESNGQAVTWCFCISGGERTGDRARCGGVFIDRGRRDADHRRIVNRCHRHIQRAARSGIGGVANRWHLTVVILDRREGVRTIRSDGDGANAVDRGGITSLIAGITHVEGRNR